MSANAPSVEGAGRFQSQQTPQEEVVQQGLSLNPATVAKAEDGWWYPIELLEAR